MANITIQRTSEYSNRLRDFKIFIDKQPIGTIANGEIKNFQIENGQHTIVAKVDWCSSPEISINIVNDETKKFKVGGFKNSVWITPLISIVIALHLILKYFFHFAYGVFLVIPAFLLLTYYLTIGRKKFLTLTELRT